MSIASDRIQKKKLLPSLEKIMHLPGIPQTVVVDEKIYWQKIGQVYMHF